ncbi:leucine-rich repeat-containing protein 46-like isoform X2 [Mercenaria mercenaria]|uniref:leucine-rich repeat-containing protein 46-like isoform X2 n=1 Tax=Mercenaria mercenaria TaxID=6596 RepID=UPI00234FB36F|nr:leucine-rich repeat-containing protein 46-like isoform X2 [Mercenaria mercenaria]XP_053373359.1 leucine-rich repeat-containing protein 46-like isoform X2 [Mercenaria mercenaria]
MCPETGPVRILFPNQYGRCYVEEKAVRLSLHLICKRHLPPDAQKWDQDKIVEALNKITHLRLDREKIGEIDSLELLGDQCTNLYLQSNRIEKIQNLECLKNLTFITLANNRIREIENLRHLRKLIFLDLSENQISKVDKDEIPSSLIILNLQGNPCTKYPNYRLNLIHDIPKLKQLDLCAITNSEKRGVGLDVPDDDDDGDDDGYDDDSEDLVDNTGQDNGHGKFESFQTMSLEMMLRSQGRAEDALREHKAHTSQLDDLRISWNVPPSSRSTSKSHVL